MPDGRRCRRPAQLLQGRRGASPTRRRTRSTRTSTTTRPTPRRTTSATGPEIWEQTKGEFDVFVAGLGHRRHASAARGRFLKEKKPEHQDRRRRSGRLALLRLRQDGPPDQAVHRTRSRASARTSSPSTMNLKILDDIVRVDDKECFLMTRDVARREGLFVGGSGGAARRRRDQVGDAQRSRSRKTDRSRSSSAATAAQKYVSQDLQRRLDARERLPRRGRRPAAPSPTSSSASRGRVISASAADDGPRGDPDPQGAQHQPAADPRRAPAATAASSASSTCSTTSCRTRAASREPLGRPHQQRLRAPG